VIDCHGGIREKFQEIPPLLPTERNRLKIVGGGKRDGNSSNAKEKRGTVIYFLQQESRGNEGTRVPVNFKKRDTAYIKRRGGTVSSLHWGRRRKERCKLKSRSAECP